MRVEDIVNKVFARSFMGYDIEQVDLFLDEVIGRFEQYESEKKEMLIAMEYLLNKLENGQKLPIAEMKKAIDTGKSQKKRATQDGRTAEVVAQAARETKAQPARSEPENPKEAKQAARSIARGVQAPKPVRAPKVARVKAASEAGPRPDAAGTQRGETVPEKQKAQVPTEQAAAGGEAPVVENWLDELLVNLIEREKVGYGVPLEGADAPDCDNGDVLQPKSKGTGPDGQATEEEVNGEESPEESDRG